MNYTLGESKSLDDITLEDALLFPIWVWALDEEGVEGQDETWQKPIINSQNVTKEMINEFYEVIITFKVKGREVDYRKIRGIDPSGLFF